MIPEYIINAAMEYKEKHGGSEDVYNAFIAGYKATKQKKAKNIVLSESQETWFEKAWEAYRGKGHKGDAKYEWAKIPESEYQSIMSHITAYVASRDISYQKDFERYLKGKEYMSIVCNGNNVTYSPEVKTEKSLSLRFAEWLYAGYPCLRDMVMPTDAQLKKMLEICDNKIAVYLDRLCDDHHEGSLYELFEERFG